MDNISIDKVQKNNLQFAKDILKEFELPFEDIEMHFENFLIAKKNDTEIGLIGMEKYSHTALLRSFAVKADYRNMGIGKMLLDALMQLAKDSGISEFYLLTTIAEKYFEKHGFEIINRQDAPVEIQNTEEFKNICPSSAICLSYKIK